MKTVLAEQTHKTDVEEHWLIFSREVRSDAGLVAGNVEIAFSVLESEDSGGWAIQPVANSPLVVFFPPQFCLLTWVSLSKGLTTQHPAVTTSPGMTRGTKS